MNTEDMIRIEEFCRHHNVEVSFIILLKEHGLVDLATEQETFYVLPDELPRLEKMVRLHYDLDVNLEGIEIITDLLQRIEDMDNETRILRNRLMRYQQE